jgi:uncharacterized lipoprotein YmbA
VVLIPWKSTIIGGYRVPVIIERFDAMPNDNLVLKSRWVMIGKDGKALEIIRETNVITPMKGRSYSSAVVAMSEALGELSKEIAAGIKSVVKK